MLIVSFFPREKKFKYEFQKGKPWMHEDLIAPFATNMIVHQVETEFKLLFFQVKPPLRFGPSDNIPTKVRADCVASVIVTADRIPKFIEALKVQLEKYQSLKQTK